MEKNVLGKAGKDVKAIKEIMERTTKDFMHLGKIFIGWGLAFLVLFIGVMAVYVFKVNLTDIITSFPVITVIPLILAAGAASISYCVITRMKGLCGLTKPLLAIWLAIVTYITLFPSLIYIINMGNILKVYYGTYMDNYNMLVRGAADVFFYSYRNISALLFVFAFGLLCLRIFTRLKFAGVLVFIYIILTVADNVVFSLTDGGEFYSSFSIICYSVIVPSTFLIVGGYLEFCRIRRS